MLDFTRFQLLTFDCYGTLIDWEAGIFGALRPMLAAHGKALTDAALLQMYGELEAEAEKGEYRAYKDVLQTVVNGFGQRLNFSPTEAEKCSLPESLPDWKPFPDTTEALRNLKRHHKLAIISNIDDDLFAASAHYLQIDFDQIITAQQARCYKPCLEIFRLAIDRIGVPPKQILHVGQSVYHDVIPAQSLGMSTVWVNRPSPRANVGAVMPAAGKPDLQVPNLETLARLAAA